MLRSPPGQSAQRCDLCHTHLHTAGARPRPGRRYVAAKHGLLGLTKVTALETAGSGVSCVAICPGWVLTPLVQSQVEALAQIRNIERAQATAALLSEKQPSGAFVTPDAVGALAAFLCSESAVHMTGECVSIDGGWGAQ